MGDERTEGRLRGILWSLSAILIALFLLWPTPARRAHAGRIPVRFWHMWTANWQGVVERICDRFNRSQERYEVIPLSVPSSGADSKFLLSVVGGDPPDCMAQWNPVLAPWVENHLLLPLDELMTPAERARFDHEVYPIVRKIGTVGGHVYGVMIGVDVYACYYRPDQFRAAGLDPDHFPRTFEELLAVGDRLNRFDAGGRLTRVGFLPQMFEQLAPAFGGGFYDERTGQVTLNTPANLRALSAETDYRKKLGFENVIRFRSGLAGTTGAEWPFITGAYSVVLDGQWRVEQLARYAPRLEYRVEPLPPPAGGKPLAGTSGGNFMIIPRGAKEVRGAWEFIKFWSGLEQPERAAEFYLWGGWLPLSPAVANAPAFQAYLKQYPQFRTFLEIMPSENLQSIPPVPYQLYLDDRIHWTEDMAARGALTPAQALAQLERDVNRERARRREMGYAE